MLLLQNHKELTNLGIGEIPKPVEELSSTPRADDNGRFTEQPGDDERKYARNEIQRALRGDAQNGHTRRRIHLRLVDEINYDHNQDDA